MSGAAASTMEGMKRPSTLILLARLGLPLVLCLCAKGAVVQTLDGKTYDGEIRLEAGQVTVVPGSGKPPLMIPLDSILFAQFKASAPETPRVGGARWQARDIGKPAIQGSVSMTGESMTVKAGGSDMNGTTDQCFLITQRIAGEGQVVAQVSRVLQTDPLAIGGMIVRGSFDVAAPYAMVLAHPDGSVAFAFRPRQGSATVTRRGAFKGPWLKIVRRGPIVSGYCSIDGADWELVASDNIALPDAALAGFAVCARNPRAMCHAVFEHIAFTSGALREGPGVIAGRGVVLRNGSVLSGQVQSASTSAVHLARERSGELSIPLTEVARILFAPAPKALASKIEPGHPGILLANGDFLEGEFEGMEGERIRMNSVLFGPKHFESRQALLVVVRDVVPAAGRYEVRTVDGAAIYCDQMTIGKDGLSVATPGGELRLAAGELLELKAGSGRFKSLADMRPRKIEGVGGSEAMSIDRTLSGVPMSVGAEVMERGIGMAAGASISYLLNAEYRVLLLKVGVPDGQLPMVKVRLVILGDGKELYRSEERTGLDGVISATVNISGVRVLTLKAESKSDGRLGASILVGNPALIK
jgi:hypothetical protein